MKTLLIMVNMLRPQAAREILEFLAENYEFGSAGEFHAAVTMIDDYDALAIGGPRQGDMMDTMKAEGATTVISKSATQEKDELCAIGNQVIKELAEVIPLMQSASESASKLRHKE